MRIVITGATGFVGGALLSALAGAEQGPSQVTCLSRDAGRAERQLARARALLQAGGGDLTCQAWDPTCTSPTSEVALALAGADTVYHLAGEQVVGRRHTAARKAEIVSSRVASTKQLVAAIRQASRPPDTLISASGVGYYGPRAEDILLDEDSPPGEDFLARLCVEWEAAAEAAADCGVRVVRARLGIALGPGGGALEAMARPIRWFVGGRLGHGRQVVSWIHLEDAARALLACATNKALSGAVNITGPAPVSNAELTRTLGRVLGRPTPFVIPAFALRLAFGDGAEPLLTGQFVLPTRLDRVGFQFRYGRLIEAARAALSAAAG